MLNNRFTWSGIRWPSIIFTPLYLHSVIMISFMLSRYWLWIAFRLYYEVNTIRYLHIHLVCDKLLVLFAIKITFFWSFSAAWTSAVLSNQVIFCLTFAAHPPSGVVFYLFRFTDWFQSHLKRAVISIMYRDDHPFFAICLTEALIEHCTDNHNSEKLRWPPFFL